MEELEQEVEGLFDEYIQLKYNRGISYGEIAYIQDLNKKELEKIYKKLKKILGY